MEVDQSQGKEAALPKHVAIIMDGNGRWAKRRGSPRLNGHQVGYQTAKQVVKDVIELKIQELTLFTLSTENLSRPKLELSFLVRLLRQALKYELSELVDSGVHLHFLGDISVFGKEVEAMIIDAIAETKTNTKLKLNIAFNYSGRWQLTHVIKSLIEKSNQNDENKLAITQELIHQTIMQGHTEPDLLIRTSGEFRISNFMLWQLAYTELYFTETLWPDFDKQELIKAIHSYQQRNRRFGLLETQCNA